MSPTIGLDTLWVLVTAFLVFFMQAGFALVETGFTRAKNAVNIVTKNFVDFCVASLLFFAVGYALMFGEGNGFIGLKGFFLSNATNPQDGKLPLLAFWIFQTVFAGTAATIVSGAVAERIKFSAYLVYTVFISGLVYPIVGHWIWGGGWLATMGFMDFAGSTVVHSVGGFAALAGAVMLGPRIGKFKPDGTPNVIAGHNIPLAALGTFILWFGWYGFNPGSNLAVGDGQAISLITVTTTLAAAAGGLGALGIAWILYGKPDSSFALNGGLAGLVGITAPCAFVSPAAAVLIGLIAGVLVVFSVKMFDRLKIDDPVGAISVHGVCGIWGTLSVGLWGQKALGLPNDGLFMGGGFKQFGIQLIGSLASCVFAAVTMFAVFYGIKVLMGLRVSRHEELRGLDIDEHGMEAYSGFQVFTTE